MDDNLKKTAANFGTAMRGVAGRCSAMGLSDDESATVMIAAAGLSSLVDPVVRTGVTNGLSKDAAQARRLSDLELGVALYKAGVAPVPKLT
jgi:hypothetical protein